MRRLVADLDIPTRIVAVPTVSQGRGWRWAPATSTFPSPSARRRLASYRALLATRNRFGNQLPSAAGLAGCRRGLLETEPAIAAIDYVATVDPGTIDPWESGPCMLAVAVRIGSVGLIDNRILD